MLSDQGADLVMAEIETLSCAAAGVYGYAGGFEAVANAMLNHLTELHRLRDHQIWMDLSDKVYSDYYEAEAALDSWRGLNHA